VGERGLIGAVYEAVTGRPWWTVRSMAAEFGPPPAVYYAAELAGLSGEELLAGPQRRSPGWPVRRGVRCPTALIAAR
jgi:hypothetical protein